MTYLLQFDRTVQNIRILKADMKDVVHIVAKISTKIRCSVHVFIHNSTNKIEIWMKDEVHVLVF